MVGRYLGDVARSTPGVPSSLPPLWGEGDRGEKAEACWALKTLYQPVVWIESKTLDTRFLIKLFLLALTSLHEEWSASMRPCC